jgi:hypothetical protein
MSDNLVAIGHGFYVVKTQAGFRKLLKMYEWKAQDVLTGDEYPSTYPSLVSVGRSGPGDCWIHVNAVSIDTLTSTLQEEELLKI